MDYEVKKYKGYRYVTIRMRFGYGHVCGYVEIPKEHYLFEVGYSDPVPELEPFNKEVLEGASGKRGSMTIFGYALSREDNKVMGADMFFDVHGSLSFGGKLLLRGEGTPIFDWALGFDTAHCDDDSSTQTHEFCEKECRSFIDQLVVMDKRILEAQNVSN
jgi:hypothetical protein